MSANNKNVEYGWYSWLRRATKVGSRTPQKNKQARQESDKETLVRFGITDQLQELVKGFTLDTFKEHQEVDVGGVGQPENASLVGNVRQDLNEWQVKHANLVLSNVKEISQLRYVLCPRHMKERQFWDIYFKLVKNYVQQYELLAARESRLESLELEDGGSTITTTVCEVEMMDASNPHA